MLQEHYDPTVVFMYAGVCTSLGVLITWFFLLETNTKPKTYKEIAHKMNPVTTLRVYFSDERLFYLSIPYSITYIIAGIYIIFVLHMQSVVHATHMQVGYYLCLYGKLFK